MNPSKLLTDLKIYRAHLLTIRSFPEIFYRKQSALKPRWQTIKKASKTS